jgi:hypothetical protein
MPTGNRRSLDVLVVGQVMTDLYASGGGTDDYAKRPKGNLDVTAAISSGRRTWRQSSGRVHREDPVLHNHSIIPPIWTEVEVET